MLVCNVSQLKRRTAIVADIAEAAAASDVSTQGHVVFATLVDDPANVLDRVDAFRGSILIEAATAASTVDAGLRYISAMAESVTATDTESGIVVRVVIEAASASDTSSATTSSAAWTPGSLATLKGWYQGDLLTGADNSILSSWPDSSGHGNNAGVNASPKLRTAQQNSLNVVQCTFPNFFTLPNLLSGASAAAGLFVAKTITTGNGAPFGNFGTDSLANNYPWSDNNVYDGFASTARKSCGNPGSLTVWHIGSFHSAASNWKYFRNGTQAFSTATNTVGIGTSLHIGEGGGQTYEGMIGEVIIVNEFLSDADRQKCEGYLAWKWGLVASLDVSHPYKSSPP